MRDARVPAKSGRLECIYWIMVQRQSLFSGDWFSHVTLARQHCTLMDFHWHNALSALKKRTRQRSKRYTLVACRLYIRMEKIHGRQS